MNDFDFLKELRRGRKDSILDSIYINAVTDDGIICSVNNRYVKLYRFFDINFVLKDFSRKREILDEYKRILNVIDTSVELSIIFRNRRVVLDNTILFDETDEKDIDLKKAINETIKNNVDKKGNTYVIDKYIEFSIKAKDIEDARDKFLMIEDIFTMELTGIDNANIESFTKEEIYKYIALFYNKKLIDEDKTYLDYIKEEKRKDMGITFKEMIKPTNIIENDNEMIVSDRLYRMFYLHSNYNTVNVNSLHKIMENDFEVITCIKMKKVELPEAIKQVELEMGNADGDISRIEMALARQKLSKDLVPQNLQKRKKDAIYINDSLKERDENLFDISMYSMIYGTDIKELNDRTYKFQKKSNLNGFFMSIGSKMQENIYNSIMPNGVNETPYIHTYDTESLCGFNIFRAKDIIMKNGDYYGVNKLTNNPILYDNMSGDNYSLLIFGMAGAGKSFIYKALMIYRALRGLKRQGFIMDPENEWGDLTRSVGGEVAEITAGGKTHINLFDIDLSYGDNSISDKEDFILAVCSDMMHKAITSGQRTTISQAVSMIYEKWLITNDSKDIPTIIDFTRALKKIVEESKNREDKEILRAVEYYSDKSHCTLFRGKTNIDLNNKLICFDLSKLGKDLRTLAMEVLCDMIWIRLCKNKKILMPTDVIIDEFHLMFKQSETANWMSRYWKMLRKYKGCPVGITQNPEDVLSSEEGRAVINNTNMSILMSMVDDDRQRVKKEYNFSDEELKYIRNRKRGEGLIHIRGSEKLNDQVTIPFYNKFEKSNLIYRLINTSYDAQVDEENEKSIEKKDVKNDK